MLKIYMKSKININPERITVINAGAQGRALFSEAIVLINAGAGGGRLFEVLRYSVLSASTDSNQ